MIKKQHKATMILSLLISIIFPLFNSGNTKIQAISGGASGSEHSFLQPDGLSPIVNIRMRTEHGTPMYCLESTKPIIPANSQLQVIYGAFRDPQMLGILAYGYGGNLGDLQARYGINNEQAEYGTQIAVWHRSHELGIGTVGFTNYHNYHFINGANPNLKDYIYMLLHQTYSPFDSYNLNLTGTNTSINANWRYSDTIIPNNPATMTVWTDSTVAQIVDAATHEVIQYPNTAPGQITSGRNFKVRVPVGSEQNIKVFTKIEYVRFSSIVYAADNVHQQAITADPRSDSLAAEIDVHFSETLGNIQFNKIDAQTKKPLANVEFKATGTSDTNKDVVYTATSDANGTVLFSNVKVGTYNIVETKTASADYEINKTIFTSKVIGNGIYGLDNVNDNSVTNNQQTILIEKRDSVSNQLVANAEYSVIDVTTNKVVTTFTSKTVATNLTTLLEVGKSYRFEETKAPAGYFVAEPTTITIESGKNTYTLKDIPYALIKGIKVDATTKKPLENTEFTLYDSQGKSITTVKTDGKGEFVFDKLALGTYTVKETKATNDYLIDSTLYTVQLEKAGQIKGLDNKEGSSIVTNDELKVKFLKVSRQDGEPLEGAIYELLDDSGKVVMKATTVPASGLDITAFVEEGKTYLAREIQAPSGFQTENMKFTVSGGAATYTVTAKDNEFGKIKFIKVNEDGKSLANASFTLYDSKGKVIAVSTSNAQGEVIFINIPQGKYTIRETGKPGTNFVTNHSIYNATVDWGKTTLELVSEVEKDTSIKVDKKTTSIINFKKKVEISKESATTGKELPGAKMQIKDIDGNIIHEWISSEESNVFTDLEVGKTYVLHEDLAPIGYALTSDIEFTVSDNNEVQKVTMIDEPTKTKINKVDANGKPLAGATLEIRDASGKVVATHVSDGKEWYIEKLPAGTYTLVETQAPLGYELAQPITFEVKNDGTVTVVTMTDELAPALSQTNGTTDNTLAIVVLGSIALSAAVLTFILIRRGKK